jgi:hypothetical protein
VNFDFAELVGFRDVAKSNECHILPHELAFVSRDAVRKAGELQSQEDRHSCLSFLPDRNVWPPGLFDFADLLVRKGGIGALPISRIFRHYTTRCAVGTTLLRKKTKTRRNDYSASRFAEEILPA